MRCCLDCCLLFVELAKRDLLQVLIEVRKMFRDTDTDNSGTIDDLELEVG